MAAVWGGLGGPGGGSRAVTSWATQHGMLVSSSESGAEDERQTAGAARGPHAPGDQPTGADMRRICDLFGLAIDTAVRYAATLGHPDLANHQASSFANSGPDLGPGLLIVSPEVR
jgi:hypothetical protein